MTSLEEDLDLCQTSSVLKDGASDQGNGQQYSPVDGTPVPCSLRGTHRGEFDEARKTEIRVVGAIPPHCRSIAPNYNPPKKMGYIKKKLINLV